MNEQSDKLRSDPVWQDASAISEYIYSQLDHLIENYPEEKWATASKLRTAANDGLFFISKAVAGTTPDSNLHDWDQARRLYFALQAQYLLASKQHFIQLDPTMVVKLDKLLATITQVIDSTNIDIQVQADKELEPWLKKYDIWRKIKGA